MPGQQVITLKNTELTLVSSLTGAEIISLTQSLLTKGATLDQVSALVRTWLQTNGFNADLTIGTSKIDSATGDSYVLGKLGVGVSNPEEKLEVLGNILIPNNNYYESENIAGANVAVIGITSSDVTILGGIFVGAQTSIRSASGEAIRIDATGQVGVAKAVPTHTFELGDDDAAKTTTTTWTTTSDKRLKKYNGEGLADLQQCYDAIKNIPLRYFSYDDEKIDTKSEDNHMIGFFTDDVKKVFPKSIITRKKELLTGTEETEIYEEQKTEIVSVEKEIIEVVDGKAIKRKVTKEIEMPVFEEIDLEDENGNIIGKHKVPVMETKTRTIVKHDIMEDAESLNVDQINKAMFGALQLAMKKIEELEKKIK
jgi:hypothetical protein